VVPRWYSGGTQVVLRWYSSGTPVVLQWYSSGTHRLHLLHIVLDGYDGTKKTAYPQAGSLDPAFEPDR
jgi:hypothetical protein